MVEFIRSRFVLRRDGRYWKVVREDRSGPGFTVLESELTIGDRLSRSEAIDLLEAARQGA